MLSIKLAQLAIRSGTEYAAFVMGRLASGELTRAELWHGWDGAGKYARAVASGDAAGECAVDERQDRCSVCPSRVPDPVRPDRLGHCGPRFQPTDKTCGCPIEAMTAVASSACPQGHWAAVERAAP